MPVNDLEKMRGDFEERVELGRQIEEMGAAYGLAKEDVNYLFMAASYLTHTGFPIEGTRHILETTCKCLAELRKTGE